MLLENYKKTKYIFHNYISNIKSKMECNIFNIINPTLIKNPYESYFIRFFFKKEKAKNIYITFFISIFKFYVKNTYIFFSYLIGFFIFKKVYKKDKKINKIIVDVFALVDRVNKQNKFEEGYLGDLYKVLDENNIEYSILIRLYNVNKKPFKLFKFFRILNKDNRNFLLEYHFLKYSDFIKLFYYILVYPFKTLHLLQPTKTDLDKLFNYSLIKDFEYFSLNAVCRYLITKELRNVDKIFSWSEFQVIERSFNYGLRKYHPNTKIIALQFLLIYETYFNIFIDENDERCKTAPDEILVNGKYYIKNKKYKLGVSLRYKNLFKFLNIQERDILVLGSYFIEETQYILDSLKEFRFIFKSHPVVDIKNFRLSNNVTISDKDIYELFKYTKIVISSESGTLLEAVASGISVIVVVNPNKLPLNPLVEYGKGKIWDIAFNENDIKKRYNQLLEYRKYHKEKIKEIADWYRDNFFVNPTKDNIIKTFIKEIK